MNDVEKPSATIDGRTPCIDEFEAPEWVRPDGVKTWLDSDGNLHIDEPRQGELLGRDSPEK
ncbi:MAG: hypothetical protein EG825_08390 [Rhodocyclaceae bacterium]|nr:hypothetical protein [Rhodocyclaceae bacterium]